MSDGDTLFALGTGHTGKTLGMMTLSTMAAEAVAIATARAVLLAQSVGVPGQNALPSWARLAAPRLPPEPATCTHAGSTTGSETNSCLRLA